MGKHRAFALDRNAMNVVRALTYYFVSTVTADINECAMDPYTCPSGCNCINREGSFTCACPAVDSSGANVTSWSCRVVDRRLNFSGSVNDGSSFSIERGCTSYTCRRGTPLRSSFSCDCSDPQQMHRACCPHCFQEEKSQCRLRATDGSIEVVANGQRFIQDCEICTCSVSKQNLRQGTV